MTQLRKLILIPALLLVLVSGFISCGEDRWPEYAQRIGLKSWMLEIMQEKYLWYNELPAEKDINLFLKPEEFLSKVKSQDDKYSFVDTILATPLPTYGFDYSLVRNPDIDTAYNVLVTYVIPGSPAASVLKRGDWIVKVDTSYISKKYEKKLLQSNEPITVTLGKYQLAPPTETPEGEDGTTEGENETPTEEYKVLPVGDPVKIGAGVTLHDNPLHCKKILQLNDGSEVGYLMYNRFEAGTPEQPELYNDQLREWSNELAQKNIHKVILDLRYNKGGSMECVQLLSTILVSSFHLNQPMAILEYNDKQDPREVTIDFDSNLLKNKGKNLDLNTLIVLISGETAGAPEMLMNSLNGKIQQMIAIGSSTKGQNLATEPFVNEAYGWRFNPVVATMYNTEKETYGGFKPTFSVNASTDYLKFKPFGDKEEALLSVALGVLNKTYPDKENGNQENAQQKTSATSSLRIEKSVSSPASRAFAGSRGLSIR